MAEPITLYTEDGEEVIVHAPSEAERMIKAGEATREKPEPKPEPARKATTRRKATTSK